MKHYILATLASLTIPLSASEGDSWKINYEHPNYFNAELSHKTSKHINPCSCELEGFIIEIHQTADYADITHVAKGFSQYLNQQSIPSNTILTGDTSHVFFLKNSSEREYFAQFAKAITWLMLNRQSSKATIRPILADKEQLLDPQRVLVMEAMQIQRDTKSSHFKSPETTIIDGFHVHIDYLPNQKDKAMELYSDFKDWIAEQEILYSALDTYPEKVNGPHVRAGWEIKFEKNRLSCI